jgi:DNA-directed RNA polymerases I, II, and III subunit RPABC1
LSSGKFLFFFSLKYARYENSIRRVLLYRGYELIRESGWPQKGKLIEIKEFENIIKGQESGGDRLQALEFAENGSRRRVCVFFHNESLKTRDIQAACLTLKEKKAFRGIIVVNGKIANHIQDVLAEVEPVFKLETFHRWELFVDITEHYLVPDHRVLSNKEKMALLKQHRLTDAQLPRIKLGDPMARFMGMQIGQVVKIIRRSKISGRYVTYRICI